MRGGIMKLSIHRNIATPEHAFECPYCGAYIRERRYSRYHARSDNFCNQCWSHYVIFWIGSVAA